MNEIVRVLPVKDIQDRWYVIPYDLIEEFGVPANSDALTKDKLDEWELKFSKYRTGGYLLHVPLYAHIPGYKQENTWGY